VGRGSLRAERLRAAGLARERKPAGKEVWAERKL
jgi:hypothetical protein